MDPGSEIPHHERYDKADNVAFSAHRHGIAHTECWCAVCEREAKESLFADGKMDWLGLASNFMHLCPDCGSKRCPKATYHGYSCSGSSESGHFSWPGPRVCWPELR